MSLGKEDRGSVEEEGGGASGRCHDGALYACGFAPGVRARSANFVMTEVLGSSVALAAFATMGTTAPAGSVGKEDHPWKLGSRSHKRSIVLFPLSSTSMPTTMFVTTRVGTQISNCGVTQMNPSASEPLSRGAIVARALRWKARWKLWSVSPTRLLGSLY